MVLLHMYIHLQDVAIYFRLVARVSAHTCYFYVSKFMLAPHHRHTLMHARQIELFPQKRGQRAVSCRAAYVLYAWRLKCV